MTIVGSIAPNMPEDRKVVPTADWGLFFKIDYNKRVLYVPQERALRMNHLLIDHFIDAVKAFEQSDLVPPAWDDITYDTDQGKEARALELLALLPSEGVIACDIETKNTGWRNNGLLCIGFAWQHSHAILITKAAMTPQVLAAVQEVFSRPGLRWTWHNGKFDTGKLAALEGLNARVDEDTMLMHYVGINERRGTHGLKDLGAIFLQAPDWDAELDAIKKDRCRALGLRLAEFDYDQFPPATLHKYAAFDVIVTYRLYGVLSALARPEAGDIYRTLIKAANTYREVEAAGVRLDKDYLEDLEHSLENRLDEAQKHFDEAVDEYWDPAAYRRDTGAKSLPKFFNLKSPAQLKWLLSKVLGEPVENTSKEVVDDLLEQHGDDVPLLAALKDVRKMNKYLDTYVTGLRDVVAPDGRIHCTYNLHGTETGRLSSSEPNMQNIPRDKIIKNLFVAQPGYRLVQFDYSQAELRVLAWLSQDQFLKNVYLEGRDLHDSVATQMFGPDFTKEQRVQAKTINFGIAYGRGPANLAQVFKIPIHEAKRLIDNWFRQMPGVDKWIQRQRRAAVGSTPPTTVLGRERHFVITHENYAHVQNEGVNFPIQSIASDMTLMSLLAIHDWLHEAGLDDRARVIITVHDSIVLEVLDAPDLVELVATTGKAIMEEVPRQALPGLDFPFKADVETGLKWGELG